jgi:hypothetical protein
MMFACGGCAQYNTFNVPKDVFYVVTAGTSVGIFKDSVSSFTISTVYPHNGWLMNLLSPGACRFFRHRREVLRPKKVLQPGVGTWCFSLCVEPRNRQVADEGLRGPCWCCM